MKKLFIVMLIVCLTIVFFDSCKSKPKVEPPKEEPKVEKVVEPQPKIEKPQLTEEELFQRRTLAEVNKMGYLKRIHFDFNKYDIRDDQKPLLEQNASWLMKHDTVRISIEGHCDERGTVEYNMALGEKRAAAARKYLVDLGVAGEKVQIVSYGKSKPLVKGIDEETHAQNRRDEFIITQK